MKRGRRTTPRRSLFRRIFEWYAPSGEREKNHLSGFIFTMVGLAIIGALSDKEQRDWLLIPAFPVFLALFWPIHRWMFLGSRRGREPEDF